MKRQLESKYKKIVDYINKAKEDDFLGQILNDYFNDFGSLANMFTELDLGDTWSSDDIVIPIIMDIYLDNYELTEPKHMYCLSGIRSLDGPMYVTFKDECYTLSIYRFANGGSQSLTDTQFQEFLNQHSKFSANMFEKLEV